MRRSLRSTKIDDEYQVESGEKQWPVGSKGGKDYDKDGDIDSKDYLTARDRAIKRTKARLKNRIQPESLELDEKEVDVKDTRRTVDAIRAYYRSKDASRDATSDTDKGKKAKGDIEKKYAKKERGEIKTRMILIGNIVSITPEFMVKKLMQRLDMLQHFIKTNGKIVRGPIGIKSMVVRRWRNKTELTLK